MGLLKRPASMPSFLGHRISAIFTQNLTPDAAFPTPSASHNAPREALGPRLVEEANFTYVRPEPIHDPRLLAVSKSALKDLGLPGWKDMNHANHTEFKKLVSGNLIPGWSTEPSQDVRSDGKPGIRTPVSTQAQGTTHSSDEFNTWPYPWSQCYGGYQFGQWAGQLGDGRAISLFDLTNSETGTRYELQLKGCGQTPYSRFADGKAVLRSSIREFVVSEYLHSIGIPTTRALSLTLSPREKVRREKIEPAAVVCRFAESWIRFGTFDLPHFRGDRPMVRKLADFVITHCFGGTEKLNDSTENQDSSSDQLPKNRYFHLYRQIARQNASTIALWQAYGFMNGVLNTDNTSILGLSLDFGPFAFMDTFNPAFSPNHDDAALRYSYKNQPSIIWWNLVRLGETLAELMAAGDNVDSNEFVTNGFSPDQHDSLVTIAEKLIKSVGEEYKHVFFSEHRKKMALRLGLKEPMVVSTTSGDSSSSSVEAFDTLLADILSCMYNYNLDFNHWFRHLSNLRISDLSTNEDRLTHSSIFLSQNVIRRPEVESEAKAAIADLLDRWQVAIRAQWGLDDDPRRIIEMKSINPNFVPRAWALDELIEAVTAEVTSSIPLSGSNHQQSTKGEFAMAETEFSPVLSRFMAMVDEPFNDEWDNGPTLEDQKRLCGDVPRYYTGLQCSCSS